MSFARFSSSDIYIFEHVGGFIQCCGCWLEGGNFGLTVEENEESWFVNLKTPREALAHLDRHEEAGHNIGSARQRIEKEYEGSLDKEIEPYVTPPPEVRERQKKRMQELFGKNFDD